jgi:hypothetical protein
MQKSDKKLQLAASWIVVKQSKQWTIRGAWSQSHHRKVYYTARQSNLDERGYVKRAAVAGSNSA